LLRLTLAVGVLSRGRTTGQELREGEPDALGIPERALPHDEHTPPSTTQRCGIAAITRDGRGLISNESDGTVSVIDLKAGTK